MLLVAILHAYRRGRSTELDQLGELSANLKQENEILEFLMILKELDNMSVEAIGLAVVEYDIDPTSSDWTVVMLRCRTVVADVGVGMGSVAVDRGCPQRGVLSSLLWCFVVDSMLSRLARAGFYSQAYAGDVEILEGGMSDLMTNALISKYPDYGDRRCILYESILNFVNIYTDLN